MPAEQQEGRPEDIRESGPAARKLLGAVVPISGLAHAGRIVPNGDKGSKRQALTSRNLNMRFRQRRKGGALERGISSNTPMNGGVNERLRQVILRIAG